MDNEQRTTHTPRIRIANACTFCKERKIKCDAQEPCGHCGKRNQACHYPPERNRKRRLQHDQSQTEAQHGHNSTPSARLAPGDEHPDSPAAAPSRPLHIASDPSNEGETEVQRESRLLSDSQGKLVFIGDCAPLSFFHSVRRLVNTLVDANAFAHDASSYSVLTTASTLTTDTTRKSGRPAVNVEAVQSQVTRYHRATRGVAHLFHSSQLEDDITEWANLHSASGSVSILFYLVLAIGMQEYDKPLAQEYFQYSQGRAFTELTLELSETTVRAFILLAIYLLRAGQLNSAFVFLGTAVRTAYSIGVHRHEVNAKFPTEVQMLRDDLWMSLRILDLFLSATLGRPPATSDVDCTVSYYIADSLLNASVQIFLITETVIVEVFSRRKISLEMTEDISRQLRQWSTTWLPTLQSRTSTGTNDQDPAEATAACQVIATYYYAVMLISRPFLMYEARRRLSASNTQQAAIVTPPMGGRSKLADACIDSACLMADLISDHLEDGVLAGSLPLLTSWLFSGSLTLGVGLAAGFGRSLDKSLRKSIQALEHFAQFDDHAGRYESIASTLLHSARAHLEIRDEREQSQRTQSSSKLFGLLPKGPPIETDDRHERSVYQHKFDNFLSRVNQSRNATDGRVSGAVIPEGGHQDLFPLSGTGEHTPDMSFFEGFPMPSVDSDIDWDTLNLFPLLEGGGLT